MSAPEFSRPVRVDTLGPAPRTMTIEADERERTALAERFGFVSLSRLAAEVELVRKDHSVIARGTIRASLAQACVATGDSVEEEVQEPFAIEFRPHPSSADDEIELSSGELDVSFYDGAVVDVGEAAAETLTLSVDPYPRSPAAEAALREAGVRSEEEARLESSPFAALKDKLGK
ncbi:MAG TPA: DUF177 domain-containing protein [Allosphingosinicella sp.]|nr:DUF177 domain-containing protein [Allosphingosinicella sp.]